MDEIEDDLVLAEVADLIERQLAYREQKGGGDSFWILMHAL